MTWATVRGWILPALKPDDGTEAELLADIIAGRATLWTGARCAMVTQFVTEATGKCVHAWLAGGDLNEIVALVPGIEAFARTGGCTHATVMGRAGWRRKLEPLGYRQCGEELKKVL